MMNSLDFWTIPPAEFPRLTDGTVHIWLFSIKNVEPLIAKLQEILQKEEREKIDNYRVESAKQSFILSRGIVRLLLSRYIKVKPENILIVYNHNSKPEIDRSINNNSVSFNLSHSGNAILIGFAMKRRIGVDIERIHPLKKVDEIAQYVFSAGEYEEFVKLPFSKKQKVFFSCWTRKEAVIKALGLSIGETFDQFSVPLTSGRTGERITLEKYPDKNVTLFLSDLYGLGEYRAAYCIENGPVECTGFKGEADYLVKIV
ncbi:MAG: 4'-phosphopantetheinyl transferase superfamily protein [Spirochaetota bacterium]